MAAYDPVQNVVEEEGLDESRASSPVFQPDTPAYDPVADVIAEEKPVFQPLHPDAQPDGDQPVFQSHHGPADDAIELPAQAAQGETHIELTRPGRPFQRTPLPEGVAPVDTDQQPLAAPRAYTLPELAAQQQAEQFGGDFAQRAPRAGAVGAAAQQALQFDPTSASALAAAGVAQQNFVQQHAQAQVNSPITLGAMGTDLGEKLVGNFQALFNTMRQGTDTDDLMINQAVDQMLPGGSPEDKAAFRQAFIAGSPDQRSQWIGALMPYVSAQPIDTAALTDALTRKADPDYQAAKAQSLANAQASAAKNLQGDPRLRGTNIGNVISQIAALPSYAAAANPLVAPVGLPMIFGRIFTDSRAQAQQLHPDWNDQQLDQSAAESAIINTVGAEAGSRIIGAGLGPLLKNIRGGYLARAAVQVPATAAAQAGVGAATQAATNIAQGQPVGDSVVEAALGQGIVGGMAGAVHAAVHPPLAPEPTTGPSGARIRGPEAATLETGAEAATAVPEARPVQPAQPVPAVVAPAPEVQSAPVSPAEPVPENVPRGAISPTEAVRVPEEQPVQRPAEQPVAPTRAAITQRAFEISQERQRSGAEGDALSDWNQAQAELAAQQAALQPAEAQAPPAPAQPQKPPPVTAEEPWVSSIANKFVESRVAAGEIGEIAPGQGYSTQELINMGERMKPQEVAQHVADVTNNQGDDLVRQAAAIRAEEARLSQRSQQASRAVEADPTNVQARVAAQNAFDDLTAFHNGPLATLKNNWHGQGMAMQGEHPIDLSTFNGMREKFLQDNGKAPPPQLEPALRRNAGRVAQAEAALTGSTNRLGDAIAQTKGKIPSADEIAASIAKWMQDFPCPR